MAEIYRRGEILALIQIKESIACFRSLNGGGDVLNEVLGMDINKDGAM